MKLETSEDLGDRITKHLSDAELGLPRASRLRKSPGEAFPSWVSDPSRSRDVLALRAWRGGVQLPGWELTEARWRGGREGSLPAPIFSRLETLARESS